MNCSYYVLGAMQSILPTFPTSLSKMLYEKHAIFSDSDGQSGLSRSQFKVTQTALDSYSIVVEPAPNHCIIQ